MTVDMAGLPPEVARYAAFFDRMTAARVPELAALVAPDVHFRDPFNDVRGAGAMLRIMAHMFETCDEAEFTVTGAMARDGRAYLTWIFRFRPKRFRGPPWHVDGVTELRFDAAGQVTQHLDFWDSGSQFYAHLPVLGWLIRMVRRRLQVAP
ncbi:MAG: nuclear transport factor 2 family protein [Sneathiellaceae bacterium]